jgi:D-sedoheptulose 7-phosphate isomerase
MSTLNRLFGDSTSLADYAARYAAYLSDLLAQLDCEAIEQVGQFFEDAREAGRTIFLIGNGGSASTASHFANDFGFGTRKAGGKAYRAISLTDNVAFISAAGNDVGYELVFVEQLKTLMNPGDVVVAISASGNSPNVIAAIEYANEHGALTVGFTGFDGGELRQIADVCVHIQTPKGDYGPVEDVHLVLDHLISSYLVRLTAGAVRQEKADRHREQQPAVTATATAQASAHSFGPTVQTSSRFERLPRAARQAQAREGRGRATGRAV